MLEKTKRRPKESSYPTLLLFSDGKKPEEGCSPCRAREYRSYPDSGLLLSNGASKQTQVGDGE